MKIIMEVHYSDITQVAILNKSYLNVQQIPQKLFHSTKIYKQVTCSAQKYCQYVVCTNYYSLLAISQRSQIQVICVL